MNEIFSVFPPAHIGSTPGPFSPQFCSILKPEVVCTADAVLRFLKMGAGLVKKICLCLIMC